MSTMIIRALNPGDVVRVRSGGPWMTVASTDGNFAECIYFVEREMTTDSDNDDYLIYDPTVHRAKFPEIVLLHIKDALVDDDDDEDE